MGGPGRAALQQGQPGAANEHFASAGADFARLDLSGELAVAEAGQSAAALAAGDWAAADRLSAAAMARVDASAQHSAEFSLQDIWWLRYQVLRAEPHAAELAAEAKRVLDQARTILLGGVADLADAGLRRSYFSKVENNRAILLEWARRNPRRARRAAPAPRRRSKLEDQFKRQLEIGVRINALDDLAALPDFIAGELEELTAPSASSSWAWNGRRAACWRPAADDRAPRRGGGAAGRGSLGPAAGAARRRAG